MKFSMERSMLHEQIQERLYVSLEIIRSTTDLPAAYL